jgi:phosphoglycolate phosphatase-like HAD superfamily hydrolase
MRTVAVTWGYLGMGEKVTDWGADLVIETPQSS